MRFERVLVTAFEPWDDQPLNSSWVAVEPLEGQVVHGAKVKAVSLPVNRASCVRLLREAATAFRPDVVVSFGMTRRERGIWRVEILARNRDRLAAGAEPVPIEKEAPRFLPTGLPAARIRGKLVEAGLPAEFSEDAGDFVCNHLFFRMMLLAEAGELPPMCGFIHVPPPELADDGGVQNESLLQEGARVVVEAITAPRI